MSQSIPCGLSIQGTFLLLSLEWAAQTLIVFLMLVYSGSQVVMVAVVLCAGLYSRKM